MDDPSGSQRIPMDASGPRRAPLDSRLNPTANEVVEPPRPPGPERREEFDPASLTTEMEAIGDDVKKRREVDHTLARFSAVHDELAEQERKRKERKQKLMPWKTEEDEDATEYAAPVVLDADGEELPPPRGRTPKHSKIVRILKIISLTSAILVFVSTGLGWGTLVWFDSKFTEVEALGSNTAAVQDAEKQYGDENFLIVGSDTRANAKPEDGVGDADKELGARSDVLMLAHIPADRKRVVVMSLPRDVVVNRPACQGWDPATGEPTGEEIPAATTKANEAYAVGGPKCVTSMMSELTHLNINHFISVDFNGFKGMVDAVGSVNVCVPRPMIDDELGTLFEKAGKYDISGDQALNYVRARTVSGELRGDFDRITRQQKFLSSLLRKVLSNEILLNPGKLNSFINAFAASTQGENVGANQLLTLGQSLQGLEAGRVTFVTMPHDTKEGPTESVNDNIETFVPEEADRLFKAIIEGTPLPGETPDANTNPTDTSSAPKAPATPGQGKIIDPKSVKLQVLNGDPTSGGAARRLKDSLTEVGFDVVRFDDSPPVDKTVIKYGVGAEDAAATLGAAMAGATLQFDAAMGSATALVIGPNFDEKVVSPQGGTAQNTASGQTTPPTDLSIVNGGADPCA